MFQLPAPWPGMLRYIREIAFITRLLLIKTTSGAKKKVFPPPLSTPKKCYPPVAIKKNLQPPWPLANRTTVIIFCHLFGNLVYERIGEQKEIFLVHFILKKKLPTDPWMCNFFLLWEQQP